MSSANTTPPDSGSDFKLLKDDVVEGVDEYSRSKSKKNPPNGGKGNGVEIKPTGVAKATGLMMAAVLLSRVLGVLRDAIISHYFGRGAQTDAYNAAFTVPDLLWNLLQSGALASTIVPIITEYRQKGQFKMADKVVGIVATTIFVFIGTLILVMEIFAPGLTRALNPGFDPSRVAMSVPLTRVLLPAQLFFFLGGLLMGVMYSRKQFLIPAFGPVIYNAGIIFGAVVLRLFFPPAIAIQGLVWGALAGAFIGNMLLPAIGVARLGVKIRPSIEILNPAAVKVWKMLLPIGLGVGLPSIDQVVNKYYASFFGMGDTTALMNAYRLMLLPIGVFAQSMAIAVFPTLSTQAADKDLGAMRSTLNQSLRNILFLTLPASALICVLANPIITFLLQSGQYKASDTEVTASVLCYLSFGIFAWSCSSLLTRGFYALQSSKVPAISGAVVSVIFIAMNASIVRAYLGLSWKVIFHLANAPTLTSNDHSGNGIKWIALSTSISAGIHCCALLFLLARRLRGIQSGKLIASVVKTVLATTALSITAFILNAGIEGLASTFVMPAKLQALLSLAVAGGFGLIAFCVVAKALKMPELETGIAMVSSKLGGVGKFLRRK